MKNLFLLSIALLAFFSTQSQVKFVPQEYANGLKYPKAVFTAEPAIEDSVNKIILSKVGDLETSDFCVGDFGYVQKGSHLQILFMCNCIDMSQTEFRYTLINLNSGTEVPFKDVFEEKSQSKALDVLRKAVVNKSSANADCNTLLKSKGEGINWDDMNLRLSKDGIEIRPANAPSCEPFPIKVSYNEFSEYLKYQSL